MAFQSRCPHCSKVLKLKSKAAFGKVAPCPQCGERFKVKPFKAAPKPEPEDEWEDEGYDEYGYDEADDDYGYDDGYDEPAPKRSSGSKKKGKGRKKKKSAGTPGWVVGLGIGAAVTAALALLVAVAMFLFSGGGAGGGANNVINLAWLPANADGYMHIKPKEMWNAPILEPLRNSELLNKAMQNAAKQGLPIEATDIDSVTLAIVGASDMYQQRQNLFGGAMGQPEMIQKAAPKTVGVMRLSKSITDNDFASIPMAEQRDVDGQQLWVAQQGMEEVAYYLADSSTVLFGEPSQVAAAITRGPTEERVERIDFANPDHQFVMVFAPEKVLPMENQTSGNSAGEALANNLGKSAKGFSLGISLTSDVELETRVSCKDSAGAGQIHADVDAALAEAQGKFDELTASASAGGFIDFSAFVDVGRETLNSFAVDQSGDMVTVSGRVPGSIAGAIEELSQNPMISMMIEGAINQAAGGGQPGMGMPPGMGPGGEMPGGPPGSGGFGTESYGTDSAGSEYNTNPDASEQANIDAVNQEKVETGEQLDGIRDKVKDTTGTILTFPGGGQRKLPTGTIGSGGDK